jgi:TPR repeat protein
MLVLIYVEYGVSIEDIASLAIVTFRIPDLTDPKKRAQIPPSVHEPLSSSMLQGCAQAEEPLAIMQILTAVYLASASDGAPYKKLASLFPQSESVQYRKTLDTLCAKAKTFPLGPEALTLQGLFLEREGKKEKAKDLYTEAVQRCHMKYSPKSRHPLQLPLITPWNALGYLLKADKSPEPQAQAKVYFNKGAIEADDPLSCYESAAFEDRTDPNWLRYTSKAAASGHRQATVDLADFYREASSKESPVLADTNMRKALNWLLEWKRGDPATLAREWLVAASNMGHKPSTLQLADYYQSSGDQNKTNEYLRRLTEPPRSANQAEEWPQLVEVARKRLAGITI